MPETLGPSKHVEPEAFRNSLNESQGRGRQRDMDGLRQGGRERMQKKEDAFATQKYWLWGSSKFCIRT